MADTGGHSAQKTAFLAYEANQWFIRNKAALQSYNKDEDIVINTINSYGIQPQQVLEIGSSAGHRLNGIKTLFPDAGVAGIDPSGEAIAFGQSTYPAVDFHLGTADQMGMFRDGQFDLVIVGFVFYVIDRHLLLKVVSEIDRVLADKGMLIMVDFFSEKNIRNNYEHITQFKAYSFKQNYDQIFSSTEMYQLVSKTSFNHSTRQNDATDDYYNKCSVTMLKKDVYASYK